LGKWKRRKDDILRLDVTPTALKNSSTIYLSQPTYTPYCLYKNNYLGLTVNKIPGQLPLALHTMLGFERLHNVYSVPQREIDRDLTLRQFSKVSELCPCTVIRFL
jgi:hypothetical protein